MVYNPLNVPITREIKINLYYAGLTDSALVNEMDSDIQEYELDRNYNIKLSFEIPSRSQKWFVIK